MSAPSVTPSAAEAAFLAAVAKEILIKDGPYGTAVQALKLAEEDYGRGLDLSCDQKGNNDLLNLTQPEKVAEIAKGYVEAGARILATNTFNANRISQADYGAEHLVPDINREAAKIIRRVVDEAVAKDGIPRFVVGALGPTNKTLSLSPRVEDPGFREVDYDGIVAVYREQIDALVEGGVDFILVETVFDTLNAKAAAFAAMDHEEETGRRLPVMLSMTITDLAGRNLSGQTVEAFWVSVQHVKPLTIGLNCSFGAKELRPHVQALSAVASAPLMVYPNAGLPNEFGGYDEEPNVTARAIREWADMGLLNVVGGCCGTTPEHIAAIAEALRGLPPRPIPENKEGLQVSGLEMAVF